MSESFYLPLRCPCCGRLRLLAYPDGRVRCEKCLIENETISDFDDRRLDALFDDIAQWTMETFPQQTPRSVALHAEKEIAELLADPLSAEEQADVVMLMIAAAASSGNDLPRALREKLEKNRARTWGTPDENGVVEHIRDGE